MTALLAAIDRSLDRRREYGVLVIRVFVAFVLIYGTQDNVFSAARMHEFRDFLAARGVPSPLAAARLSAYAQFTCGVLILAGCLTRLAAVVMIVNFIAALIIAHIGLPFMNNVPPLAMLATAIFLVVNGAGPVSVDAWLARRRAAGGVTADPGYHRRGSAPAGA